MAQNRFINYPLFLRIFVLFFVSRVRNPLLQIKKNVSYKMKMFSIFHTN